WVHSPSTALPVPASAPSPHTAEPRKARGVHEHGPTSNAAGECRTLPRPIRDTPRPSAFLRGLPAAPPADAAATHRSRGPRSRPPAPAERPAHGRPIGATAHTTGRARPVAPARRTRRVVLDRPGRPRVQPPRLQGHLCGATRAGGAWKAAGPCTGAP